MKSIPNIISLLRILLSVILFFLKPFSILFWIVYSACGFSDIIDGYIARKINSVSRLGSFLDSVGDVVFFAIFSIIFLAKIIIPMKIWIWVIFIAVSKIASIIISYRKFHEFVILHTYANKATGFLLFIFPFAYIFLNINISSYIICIIASLATIEELIIHLESKELLRDIKGIFFS
ncbi:CDP-alcohol phosphatidyltransferase family protein [Clostridium sp. HBUAS56017]|uniref:CDP-alcohol phosphatidyltransferase family protein n=1 Tax=Clostridium sp. HBUAS56017 TaxID=2571128 RepID=UPI001178779E|nr:CDP-alcohol phosphatidyltransferase family protein [Clostridium sp. HBUAS56017]